MSKIELISFDAADTLIKLTKSIGCHYASIASKYGVIADEESLNENFKKVFANTPPLGQKGLDWWSPIIQKTFAASGFESDSFSNFENFVVELYAKLSQDGTWIVYPDVETTLHKIKSLGLPIIVFSNFDERLSKVLKDLKIASYFQQIICSTQIGYAKPDTRAFAKVAELVNLKPEKIIHIGDGFENDYLAALRANFQALYLNRSGKLLYKTTNPKYEIKSLIETLQFL